MRERKKERKREENRSRKITLREENEK